MVSWLHYEYTKQKPLIAPYKPLVVGSCWTISTYAQPFLYRHDLSAFADAPLPVSMLFLFTAVSHFADLEDIDEDSANNIVTPAVQLGDELGRKFGLLLTVMAIYVHSFADYGVLDTCFDAVIFFSVLGMLRDPREAIFLFGLIALNLYRQWDDRFLIEFLSMTLTASEPIHHQTIRLVPIILEQTRFMPPALRRAVVDLTLSSMPLGDEFGSRLLNLYTDLARKLYLD